MSRGVKAIVFIAIVSVAVAFAVGLSGRGRLDLFPSEALGVLRIEGAILDVDWYMEQVEVLRSDHSVKAVVLRIDSPGGAIAPTQELHAELVKLREEKPLVVSMGTVAASGGYYLSCAGEWIVCNPGTITGSIGVIMELTNLEELFGKLGIKSRTIKSGDHKDMGSPFRELTPEEEKLLLDMIMDTHEQFVETVMEARRVDYEAIAPYFDGRVFTGRQALKLGLVDELGNINDAMRKASELAGLKEVPEEIFEPEQKRRGLLSILFGRSLLKKLDALVDAAGWGGADRALQLWRAF